jgi:hypothetical protein
MDGFFTFKTTLLFSCASHIKFTTLHENELTNKLISEGGLSNYYFRQKEELAHF